MQTTHLKAVFTAVASERLDRPAYRRIGTAFVNPDQSLTVVLDAVPVSGRLVIRDFDLQAAKDEAAIALRQPPNRLKR